jgi:photosystem II stability/assembly factor-like uncharacterized protein
MKYKVFTNTLKSKRIMSKKLILLFALIIAQFPLFSQTRSVIWTQLSFVPSQTLFSVYCLNRDTVVAVGDSGYIVRTTDGGNNWNVITSGTSNALYKLSFVNDSTGYAVGTKGTVLKTTNYGKSWINTGINANLDFCSLSFINKDTGWVAGGVVLGNYYPAGNKGILIKTINGGASWTVDSTYTATVSSVCFLDNDTGYIAVSNLSPQNEKLEKTINGGISYDTIQKDTFPTSSLNSYNNIHFINYKTGYFVKSGNEGFGNYSIFQTSNYGTSWTGIISGVDGLPVFNLFVIDSCNLYYLWWSSITSTKGYPAEEQGFWGENICNSKNFDSSDVHSYFVNLDEINDIYAININYAFGVGGNIIKRDSGIIQNVKEWQPLQINIYPNPVTEEIQVISNQCSVNSVEIYNILGEKIYQSLVTSHLLSGMSPMTITPITINCSNFASGVYFIKATTDKGVVVKKFVKE